MVESSQNSEGREIGPPDGKVIGALDPNAVTATTAALVAAGFPADRIDIVTAADLETLQGPFAHDGVRGFVERFILSLGEELNSLGELRTMASNGHTLIGVPVESDDGMQLAAKVLREHGAHTVTHFGRWTITSL